VAWNRNPAFLHIRGVSAARAGHVQANSLYAYGGLLATPGCTEDVRWPVPADGAGVSNASLTRCHKVIARSLLQTATGTITARCSTSTGGS